MFNSVFNSVFDQDPQGLSADKFITPSRPPPNLPRAAGIEGEGNRGAKHEKPIQRGGEFHASLHQVRQERFDLRRLLLTSDPP